MKLHLPSDLCQRLYVHQYVPPNKKQWYHYDILYLLLNLFFTTVTKSGRQSKNSKISGLFLAKIDSTQMLQLEHTLKLKYTLSYYYSLKVVVDLLIGKRSLCAPPVKDVNLLNKAGRLLILN